MVAITFTDAAIDDLRKLGPDVAPKILRKLLLLFDNPEAGYPLGGDLTGYRKLIVGRNTWRIVYRVNGDSSVEVCEVWAVGARADSEVYAEATKRAHEAAGRLPEFVALAEVVERLGALAGDMVIEPRPDREPVPEWLANRLTHTVGLPPAQVAALSLEEAVDAWTEHMSRPH